MPPPLHTVRASILEKETYWFLTPMALRAETENAPPREWPFTDMVELRLRFSPTRMDRNRHRCRVRLRNGQTFTIVSTSYRSPANFSNEASTYSALVRALAENIARTNPATTFIAGLSPGQYVLNIIVCLGGLGLLALVLFVAGAALFGLAGVWIKLLVILIMLPLLYPYFKANRPRRFTPETIPSDLLPRSGSES